MLRMKSSVRGLVCVVIVLAACATTMCVLPGCARSSKEPLREQGALLIRFYSENSGVAKQDDPKPGKGWFTLDGDKIEDSDFDVPDGSRSVDLEGRLDEDGKPYLTSIQFVDENGDPLGDPVKPPEGTKPNDLNANVRKK